MCTEKQHAVEAQAGGLQKSHHLDGAVRPFRLVNPISRQLRKVCNGGGPLHLSRNVVETRQGCQQFLPCSQRLIFPAGQRNGSRGPTDLLQEIHEFRGPGTGDLPALHTAQMPQPGVEYRNEARCMKGVSTDYLPDLEEGRLEAVPRLQVCIDGGEFQPFLLRRSEIG